MTKYGAKRTFVDGIPFASQKEARRYGELKLLERAGEISGLTLQPRFPIVINNIKVCTYIADFSYYSELGALTVEDVKGVETDVFKLKRKLMLAVLGIEVVTT